MANETQLKPSRAYILNRAYNTSRAYNLNRAYIPNRIYNLNRYLSANKKGEKPKRWSSSGGLLKILLNVL